MLSVRKDVEARVDQMLAEFNAEKALKDVAKATGGGVAMGAGMYVCVASVWVWVWVWVCVCVCVCVWRRKPLRTQRTRHVGV